MPPPEDLTLNGGMPIYRRRRQLVLNGGGPQNIFTMVQRIMSLTRRLGGDEFGANILESSVDMLNEPPFDSTSLKDIGNLASWTVSSFKPGCGVEELRNEDTRLFWQSDGPQPHHLNIHFTRMVSIRAIRLYLDFEADESYTPTRITMLGGTGYHDLIPFSTLTFLQPKGWINIDLKGVGGEPDGNTLRAFLIQVKIVENHQNGKDTHLRGLKIYAADEKASQSGMGAFDGLFTAEDFGMESGRKKDTDSGQSGRPGRKVKFSSPMFTEPSWMREPELR